MPLGGLARVVSYGGAGQVSLREIQRHEGRDKIPSDGTSSLGVFAPACWRAEISALSGGAKSAWVSSNAAVAHLRSDFSLINFYRYVATAKQRSL